MEKVAVELGPVQQTLLMPMWGRAVESRRKRPRLVDRTAESVAEAIDFDFSKISSGISEITRTAWIARSLVFDAFIRRFLRTHANPWVVNVGCGFDTTFERVDDGIVNWIDLDLPDVIALRGRFIPDGDRRTNLAASVFDRAWESAVPKGASVFLLAAGLFYYFEETQVRELLVRFADVFPGCELAFDIASTLGVGVANRRVIEAGGMSPAARLVWGIDNPYAMETWDDRVEIVSAKPTFAEFRPGLTLRGRFGMLMSDRLRIMSNIHLRMRTTP